MQKSFIILLVVVTARASHLFDERGFEDSLAEVARGVENQNDDNGETAKRNYNDRYEKCKTQYALEGKDVNIWRKLACRFKAIGKKQTDDSQDSNPLQRELGVENQNDDNTDPGKRGYTDRYELCKLNDELKGKSVGLLRKLACRFKAIGKKQEDDSQVLAVLQRELGDENQDDESTEPGKRGYKDRYETCKLRYRLEGKYVDSSRKLKCRIEALGKK